MFKYKIGQYVWFLLGPMEDNEALTHALNAGSTSDVL